MRPAPVPRKLVTPESKSHTTHREVLRPLCLVETSDTVGWTQTIGVVSSVKESRCGPAGQCCLDVCVGRASPAPSPFPPRRHPCGGLSELELLWERGPKPETAQKRRSRRENGDGTRDREAGAAGERSGAPRRGAGAGAGSRSSTHEASRGKLRRGRQPRTGVRGHRRHLAREASSRA
jgi:hypothetical protein